MPDRDSASSLSDLDPGSSPGRHTESILHVRRDDLRSEVRSYADNLKAQILDLFRKHGVKNVGEFESKARAHEIPEAAARELMELEKILAQVVRTNSFEGTPEAAEAREIGEELLKKAIETAEISVLEPILNFDVMIALARARAAAGEDVRDAITRCHTIIENSSQGQRVAADAYFKLVNLERELGLPTQKTLEGLKARVYGMTLAGDGSSARYLIKVARLFGPKHPDFPLCLFEAEKTASDLMSKQRDSGRLVDSPAKSFADAAMLRLHAGLPWQDDIAEAKKYISNQDSAWVVRVQELLACARVEAAVGQDISETMNQALGFAARIMAHDTREGVRAYIDMARTAHQAKLDASPYITVVDDELRNVEKISVGWAVPLYMQYLNLQREMGVATDATHARIQLLLSMVVGEERMQQAIEYAKVLLDVGKDAMPTLVLAHKSNPVVFADQLVRLIGIARLIAEAGRDPRLYFEEAEEIRNNMVNVSDIVHSSVRKWFTLAYARAALRFFKYPYMQQVPAAAEEKKDE